jgi:hypothetical protein
MGAGANTVVVSAEFHGATLRYVGGAGTDIVSYAPIIGSTSPVLNLRLGAGSDTVGFGPGPDPSFAFVDFGSGADTLVGTIDFAVTILNLP